MKRNSSRTPEASKSERGAVRPAQQALADAGHSAIVRSLDDLRRVLIEHGISVSIGAP